VVNSNSVKVTYGGTKSIYLVSCLDGFNAWDEGELWSVGNYYLLGVRTGSERHVSFVVNMGSLSCIVAYGLTNSLIRWQLEGLLFYRVGTWMCVGRICGNTKGSILKRLFFSSLWPNVIAASDSYLYPCTYLTHTPLSGMACGVWIFTYIDLPSYMYFSERLSFLDVTDGLDRIEWL